MTSNYKSSLSWAVIPFTLALLFPQTHVAAATTDLADGPLANGVSGATTVKPNIAFIVDDSGSMDDQNMPDGDGTNKSKKCWGWYNYNTLAYNPNLTYKPPYKPGGAVYSDGVERYPDANFSAALKDGYFSNPGYTYGGNSSSNGTVDLGNTSNLPTSASTKYYYTYATAAGDQSSTSCLTDTKYTAITSSVNIAAPGVTTGSAAAQTNYANWYSYYRRRAFLMKAAASEAFKDVSDSYRVGLFFIDSAESGSGGGTGQPNHDLIIDDFSGTHRSNWFTRLQGSRSSTYTPLRGALSRIGRMYAGKISGWDPVQYSCQQNFTILSTDGYWNTNWETSSYGPLAINGTSLVGDTDGGPAAAQAAQATITFGSLSSGTDGYYYATSLTVGGTQLLDSATVPNTSGTSNRDTLGSAIATSINNRTGTTGYSASYDNGANTLTITAPLSAGALTSTPTLTTVKTSGNDHTVIASQTAFSGYRTASDGAARPYLDALHKSDTLADVAYYYYQTDLRTSALGNCSNTIGATTYNNLCDNNVPGTGRDVNSQQHMTTFTLGLGTNGTLPYRSDYETASSGSYYDIINSGLNWPDPISNTGDERIDDLWHAAVNGRGYYYTAKDPTTLSSGISSALSGVTARTGSSSAAATSNLEPVAGDNFVYVALYRTLLWDGDVKAYTIDPDTGAISSGALWSAQTQLDQTVSAAGANADGRTIKYFSTASGNTNNLKNFTYTNLNADGKGAYFTNFCSKTPAPAQCGSATTPLTTAQQTLANNGDNLVNYLRGQTTYEADTNTTNPLYRSREHILGDIVNAVPVYAKVPPFSYDTYDTTYATFKSSNANRSGTVFVAANDGMLHAVNADNGTERWAFVPSFVMSRMWQLGDTNYGSNHRYYVDGSPSIADICSSLDTSSTANPKPCASSGSWKTILIGGLNKGGCGYYALDITDPANPKGLWEFTNANLGYTFGNPIVTRRPSDGKWVAIFTSGYNNVPGGCGSTGDGNGHVFVVDADTGTLLDDIPTYTTGSVPAGTTTTPNGLSKLNAWVENADVNVASRLYGGDLLGNVWRIDFDDTVGASGKEAMLLGEVQANSIPQPVTTKPELATVTAAGVTHPVVFVGTGEYLGLSDPSNTNQQSVYALKDKLTSTGLGDVRNNSAFVSRTMSQTTNSSGQAIRTVSGDTIDWATDDGWYLDLNPGNLSPTERVNVDMQLQFNILTVAGNVPESNVCTSGGYAWLYNIDINTGKNLVTASDSAIGMKLGGNALVAGIKVVRLANGKTVTIVTSTSGDITVSENPSPTGSAAGSARRTMWREIVD